MFITKSEKSNCTILIEISDYNNKVELALKDEKYYTKLNKNPLPKLIDLTKSLLSSWKNKGVFEDSPYFKHAFGIIDYSTLPRAYGSIKLHKNCFPVRIVVSAIGGPLYFFR